MKFTRKATLTLIATFLIGGTALVGCGKQSAKSDKGTTHTAALVTAGGGVDDKSFNESAWNGLKAWGKENNLEKGVNGFNYAESASDADFVPNFNKLIKAKYQTIFGNGFNIKGALEKVAVKNPKTNFAIIDEVIPNKKNITSITFKTEQSSYLAGVAAAKTTKTNKVGFVGGMESNVIKSFETGFIQGVHAVNPKIKVDVKYAGSFAKADLGQSIATAMYNNGADIIFHAAGGTGNGVFTAAKDLAKDGKHVWVIGVDQDQLADGKYKGGNVTLVSAVKEVGNAVQDVSNRAMKDKFPGGKILSYDLKNKGVNLVKDNLSDSNWKVVQQYKTKIMNGDIQVKSK